MLLKKIYFISLLLGTLFLFVLSAISMNGVPASQGVDNYFQFIVYSFFVILLVLSNIMYFNLGKTIYLLISLIMFLFFLDFYWIFVKSSYPKAAYFSSIAIFLVVLNYYLLRNYFKSAKHKK